MQKSHLLSLNFLALIRPGFSFQDVRNEPMVETHFLITDCSLKDSLKSLENRTQSWSPQVSPFHSMEVSICRLQTSYSLPFPFLLSKPMHFQFSSVSWLKNEDSFHVVKACLSKISRSVLSDTVTPWIAARQASLSITNSRSSFKLTSIRSVMPSSHLILCHPWGHAQ